MAEKILLVDDEADFLEALSERMRTRGMDVTTSASAKEALDAVEQGVFDAVVLDLMMPDVDGLEALLILGSSDNAALVMTSGFGEYLTDGDQIDLGQ